MTAEISCTQPCLRIVVIHAPERQQQFLSLQRMLSQLPRRPSLRIIPLSSRGRLFGLQPIISDWALRHADAVVLLSKPCDPDQIRACEHARRHPSTVFVDASDPRVQMPRLAGQLLDRLFPVPIRDVLCMFACPDDCSPLALHHEWQAIDDANKRVGKPLALASCWAARVNDLQDALLGPPRDLLHFSGHGEPGGVYFETHDGHAQPVSTVDVIRVLAQHRPRCLVFNACHSADTLTAVRGLVPYVIAMHGPTTDRGAIEFSRAFYSALAHGRTVPRAFKHAFEGLGLHGHAEDCRPRLLD